MLSRFFPYCIGVCIFLLLFSACREDNYYVGDNAMITVSTDTIRFDTVFTTIGTTTKFFKIFNEQEATVVVDEISLADRTGFFRLNINGTPGNKAENIEIPARDSIYVFVEATIDPDLPLSMSPYILEDHVNVFIDDSETKVYLEAWGQNANYIPSKAGPSSLSYYSCDLQQWVWDDPKPYVVYGTILIDSCDIVLPPGTEVYVHGGVAFNDLGIYNAGLFYLFPNAKILSQGTLEEPVTIFSDRLEEEYQDQGGQWSGIILSPGSRGSRFDHTTIRHSVVGVRVDSSSSASFYSSEIGFTSGTAIIGRKADVYAENCLFHNNGISALQAVLGGNYEFNNCSIINYNNQDEAIQLFNYQCIDEGALCLTAPPLENPLKATFRNCLIVGNDQDEIFFRDWTPDSDDDFNYRFDNCVVQVNDLLEPERFPNFFNRCTDCINNPIKDTLFISMDEYDFHLDTFAFPIDAGKVLSFIPNDKDGNARTDGAYDIGCYEFID